MFGLEFSIPILIVSLVQGCLFLFQFILDKRVKTKPLLSKLFVFASFLALYNLVMTFTNIQESEVSAVIFIILGAYYATVRFEPVLRNKTQFAWGFVLNIAILTLIYLLLIHLNLIQVSDQVIVLSIVLLIFYISSGAIVLIQNKSSNSNTANKILISLVFTVILFLVFFFNENDYQGVIAINLFFSGIVAENIFDMYFTQRFENTEAVNEWIDEFHRLALTQKQLEVIELIAAGKDIQGIADHLALSKNAVETRLSRIYKKTPYKSFPDLKAHIFQKVPK